jgi:hypothetical protein
LRVRERRTEPAPTLAEKWRAGLEAFNRGEMPPTDPDAADG